MKTGTSCLAAVVELVSSFVRSFTLLESFSKRDRVTDSSCII